MKKPSNDLFQLIQSLNEDEKKFITTSISANKKNSHNELLFIYLNGIKEYDEKKLLLDLPYVKKNNIKHSKLNLYNYLLDKLALHYSETDAEQQINKLLTQARILYSKKLYKKAEYLLSRALEKAKLHNLFLLEIQLQAEQQYLFFSSNEFKKYEFQKKQNVHEFKALFNYFQQMHFCKEIEDEIRKLHGKKTGLTDVAKHQKYVVILNSILIIKQKNNYRALPEKIRLQLEYTECLCLFMLNQYKKAKTSFLLFLAHVEKSIFQSYEDILKQLIVGCAIGARLNDISFLMFINEKADTIFKLLPFSKHMLNNYYAIKNNLISFFLKKNDFNEIKKISDQLETKIAITNATPMTLKIYFSNLCQTYLCNNQPKKALELYNIIVNNKALENIRPDINYTNNLLALAIFYEFNMTSNTESLIRSCKRDKLYEQQSFIYKALIQFFAIVMKAKDAEKIKELFTTMIRAIDAIKKTDKLSLAVIYDIEIRYWLTDKLASLSA